MEALIKEEMEEGRDTQRRGREQGGGERERGGEKKGRGGGRQEESLINSEQALNTILQ